MSYVKVACKFFHQVVKISLPWTGSGSLDTQYACFPQRLPLQDLKPWIFQMSVPKLRTVKGVHSVRIIAKLQGIVAFLHLYGISSVNTVECQTSVVRGFFPLKQLPSISQDSAPLTGSFPLTICISHSQWLLLASCIWVWLLVCING